MSEELDPSLHEPFWLSREWWLRAGRATAAVWIATVIAFLGTVIAARELGPTGYGSMLLAISVASLVATLLDLTLEEAIVHHGSRLLKNGATLELRRLLRTAVWIECVNGLAVLVLTVALASMLGTLISGDEASAGLVRIAAISIFFSTFNGTIGAVFLLDGRPDLRAWLDTWGAFVRLATIAIAITVEADPASILIAFAVAAAIGALTQGAVAWRRVRRRWAPRVVATDVRTAWLGPLVRFGIHSGIATSVLAGRGALLPIIFGRIAGAHALGLLNAGMLPVNAAAVASAGLRMSLLPEQAKLAASGDWATLRRSIRGHMSIGVLLAAPAAGVGFFVMPWLITTLYSPAFGGSVEAARILLLAAVIQFALSWTKTLPGAIGRPQLRTWIAAIDLAVSASLVWALADSGVVGAAGALVISTAAVAAVWIYVIQVRSTRWTTSNGSRTPSRDTPPARLSG